MRGSGQTQASVYCITRRGGWQNETRRQEARRVDWALAGRYLLVRAPALIGTGTV